MALTLHPIGRVEGRTILVRKRWAQALAGIEGFSHLIVLFWLSQAHKPVMKIHPKGIRGIPRIGYLATRTPHRANPIGMTVVRLIRRRANRLWVEGLDAWDATPVLDLKPYTKKDAVRRFRMPAWVKLLDKAEVDPLRKYAG
jgi:tRNA-Thr(GGU) m(6)t(6)A37 methyltransferase TsaA